MLKAPKPYRKRRYVRYEGAPISPPPGIVLSVDLSPDQETYGTFDDVEVTVSWTGSDDGQVYVVTDADGNPMDTFIPMLGGGPQIYDTNVGDRGDNKKFAVYRQSDGANYAQSHPFDSA